MSEEIIEKIKEACRTVSDPHMGVSILEMGILRNIEVDGKIATLTIQPTNPSCMSVTRIASGVKQATEALDEKCPKCGEPLVLFTTAAGKKMKKCSTSGWDRDAKKATGCDYVLWLKANQTSSDNGEEYLPPEEEF